MTARFERVTPPNGECEELHWFWVVGGGGAVSTWFSPGTKEIIGWTVCSGACVHSPLNHSRDEGWYNHEGCEFLEVPCWSRVLSLMRIQEFGRWYDLDDHEQIYAWLESHLDELAR